MLYEEMTLYLTNCRWKTRDYIVLGEHPRNRDICFTGDRGAIRYSCARGVGVHPRMCIEISTHPGRHPDPIDLSQVPSGPGRLIQVFLRRPTMRRAGRRNTSTLGRRAALTRARGSELPRDSITAYQHRTN